MGGVGSSGAEGDGREDKRGGGRNVVGERRNIRGKVVVWV